LSIGYISGQAKGTHAKGGINNQSLITGFSITILVPITQFREPLKIYELPKRLAI
jgi:hypothetical protein